MKLTRFEFAYLNALKGHEQPQPWGGAVGQTEEVLRGNGLIDVSGNITAEGENAWAATLLFPAYRDGTNSKVRRAGDLRWLHENLPDDIMGYRVMETEDDK